MKLKKQPEVRVIEKVFDFINEMCPGEVEKASKEFEKMPEARISVDEKIINREFMTWFLLFRRIKGATPMELTRSFPLDFFTKKDRKIMDYFAKINHSFFEIKSISSDNKEYTILDSLRGKEYLVKTSDLEPKLDVGEFIIANVVRKIGGGYFFYGNIASYNRESGLEVLRQFKKGGLHLKRRERQLPEIEWEIH